MSRILLSLLVAGCGVATDAEARPEGGCIGCVANEGVMLSTLADAGYDAVDAAWRGMCS